MEWYYVKDEQRQGPVGQDELESLLELGEITEDTLVWHDGMSDWQPYSAVLSVKTPASSPAPEPQPEASPESTGTTMNSSGHTCSQCGKVFPDSQLGMFGGELVCNNCRSKQTSGQRHVRRPGQVQHQGTNSPAVTGLILSIVGLFCCQFLSIAGLIVSINGLNQANSRPDGEGRGVAIAGIVVAIVGLALGLLGLLIHIIGAIQ